MKAIGIIVLAILMTACAASQKIAKTTSGLPEVEINSINKELIKENIINRNAQAGWENEQESNSSLLFTKIDTSGSFHSIMTQAIIGNSYSTPPKYEARYVITKIGSRTKIVVNASVSTQMAFGQVNKYPLNDNNDIFNVFQKQLYAVKEEVEAEETSKQSSVPQSNGKENTPKNLKYMFAAETSSRGAGCSDMVTIETAEPFKEIYSATCQQGKKIFIVCSNGQCAIQ